MSEEKQSSHANGIILRPFKGWHPPSHLMSAVASPPYDVINTAEAKKITATNEKSFLHVNKPETHFDAAIDAYDDRVYEMGRTQIEKFCRNRWLIEDAAPCLYIYSQRMPGHAEQFGVVGECSAVQYEQELIKKHELTRKKKEDDRTKLTDVQSANVGPIFLCYKSVDYIDELIASYVAQYKPYVRFTADDGVTHTLWIVSQPQTMATLSALFAQRVPCCYVADGHHRTASAYRVYQKRKQALQAAGTYRGDEAFHYFLAVLFPHHQLTILEYNRVVDSFGVLHGQNRQSFLNALSADWVFDKLTDSASGKECSPPQHANDYRMYIAKDGWYRLRAKTAVVEGHAKDVVKRLDVSILSQYLLQPIMGITDIRSDPSISFLGGIHGLAALQQKVDAKGGGVAFALYHTSIQQLLDVADAQKLMPPKSTWFEPKLRSGVIVRRF
eukprot:CAMPEP_0202688020 /NCGR_PEP_ID=MMETSP1385-20130828/3554_1 /ASSEMBLY_ACC=CAM_ASM_000861 /TAXON_ID=933848 /ORGANISM="Elphidium margaritaceum" /LENGTH=441 /DNA_ID=CAMNT_0049342891 /DNA_START=28 /DNA_END=1353 /DNA_ORIENTATION=+